MTFDDLLATLKWRDDVHIVDLARALLLVCRTLEGDLRRDRNDASRAHAFVQIRQRAFAWFEALDGERLDARDAAELLGLLEDVRASGDAIAARAVAEGLDDALGVRFAGSFVFRPPLTLRPRDAFPVHPPAAYLLVTRVDRSGNPALRTPAIDRLRHLRLAPDDMRGIDVELIWQSAALAHLTTLTSSSKFAVAHPVVDPSSSFRWQRYTRDGVGLFYGVQPRDAEAHWETVTALVSRAADQRVAVLALPELCLTDELFERLRVHPRLAEIPLLVAGSRHVEQAAPGENEAVAFAHGRQIGHHQKFHPFEFDDDLDDSGIKTASRVRRREDIRPRAPRLRLHVSSGWSMVVLICKDAIDRDVGELLRALQVQLVVVPSWSDTTDDYDLLARALAADPQAITLVANLPGAPGVQAALFGRPVRDPGRRILQATIERPGVLWFDLNGNLGNLL